MATPLAGEAPPKAIKIGTRRSALALKQVDQVIELLKPLHPDVKFEVCPVSVAGDRDKVSPLPSMGKGLWTNEMEAMLVAGELDIIVHSLKDMPTTLPEGCVLASVPTREDPRDVVIIRKDAAHASYRTLADLPEGSLVGTSSVRRSAQLKRRYPGLRFKDFRGNIDSRLRKLDAEDSEFDCIILAAAGLLRMDFGARISQFLESGTEGGGVLHAVGQGGLGIECREGDEPILNLVRSIADPRTMSAISAERTVMRVLEGGCSVPIGVETKWEGKELKLKATVVSLDGSQGIDTELAAEVASIEEAEALGKKTAQDLVAKGAGTILADIIRTRMAPPPAKVEVA